MLKKIKNFAITIAIIIFLLYVLVMNFVVSSDGQSTQDLLGFNLATPPAWVGAIPYFGSVVEFFYQAFTLHEVFSIWLPLIILGVFGSLVMKLSKDEDIKTPQQKDKNIPFLADDNDEWEEKENFIVDTLLFLLEKKQITNNESMKKCLLELIDDNFEKMNEDAFDKTVISIINKVEREVEKRNDKVV